MPDVVLIRWPEESQDAVRLAAAGTALLYLVNADDDPPVPAGCLEDWVRMPGDERDLRARIAALELRAAAHSAPPHVDDSGSLHYHGKQVMLSAVEARLATALTARFDDIVSDDELLARASGGHEDAPMSLRVEIAHLRSRLRHVDLRVSRIARRGYRLRES